MVFSIKASNWLLLSFPNPLNVGGKTLPPIIVMVSPLIAERLPLLITLLLVSQPYTSAISSKPIPPSNFDVPRIFFSSIDDSIKSNCLYTFLSLLLHPVWSSKRVDNKISDYIQTIDILGLDSFSPNKGQQVGLVSFAGSSVFDIVPINPTNVSIPF